LRAGFITLVALTAAIVTVLLLAIWIAAQVEPPLQRWTRERLAKYLPGR
jgi:hypothetical protein